MNSGTATRPIAITDEATWYKDAVIYQLHVKSFFDSNDDGVGDFAGLISKLDYIETLGVNTVWLLPFFPSPLRDDGYDIAEYCGVNPDYGSIDDVKHFIDEAHARGLRVIIELVINHTSDQHPWFQRARQAPPGSIEREFYVWSDNDKKYPETRIIFLDTEKSNWAWDPVAEAYYWHRFYSHQPDLNYDNPAVLDAILEVMTFWLDLGVDGLRLDAVPYLVEREGTINENLPETHDVLKKIRAVVNAKYPDRMLLAEANQWPEDAQVYFGDGDECHMAFHFPLMPRMYMSLAQEDRFPITDILRQTPDIPPNCQWAIFLRNHDELTLEMVTDRERDYLWNQYASEARARLNLGIRRRLAPLMQKDRRRVELMHSLLLSMPGTPILYYGDEIGMGDNIFLGDRDGVRTPMQWSPDRNGGFSRADPARVVLPVIMDALYGYTAINVEAQSRDPHSFLNWVRTMLEIRKRYPAFGRGTLKMLYPTNRRVLAYIREHRAADGSHGDAILCLANMSRAAQAVELDLSTFSGLVPLEMTGGSLFPPIGDLPYLLTLPPYGFYWFLLAEETQFPEWHVRPPEPLPDFITLVLRRDIAEIAESPVRNSLERDVLPSYLPKRRWFAGKDAVIQSIAMDDAVMVPALQSILGEDIRYGNGAVHPYGIGSEPIVLSQVVVTLSGEPGVDESEGGARQQRYQIPLTAIFEKEHPSALAQQLALARVRRRQHVGFLTDAVSLECLSRSYLALFQAAATKADGDNQSTPAMPAGLAFHVTDAFASVEFAAESTDIRLLSGEQSNSSVIIGEQAVMKLFRRLFPGPNPEVEVGRVLTQQGFANTAALLGYVSRTRRDDDGNETLHILAVLQQFIASQGDAWDWVLSKLDRLAVEPANRALQEASETDAWAFNENDVIDEVSTFTRAIGMRLAEMHAALAAEKNDPAFAPQHATATDCERWARGIRAQVERALQQLSAARDVLDIALQQLADAVLEQREAIFAVIENLSRQGLGSLLIRIHGDLHLGQILVAQNDAYFIDFEGEPAKSLAERRAKASPLRDVAGILRSLDYVTEVHPGRGRTLEGMVTPGQEFFAEFKTVTTETFLNAYFAAAENLGHRWHSSNSPWALTDLFTLEKAAYEICYESANRPQWLHVPLKGFARIISQCGVDLDGASHR